MHIREVTLLSEKYPINEFYPFDLDIMRQTRSLSFSHRVTFFIGENGTGKSPILLACPDTRIYSFDHSPARQIHYQDTEHYQVYRKFMEDPYHFDNPT
jgi:predicted ATPase